MRPTPAEAIAGVRRILRDVVEPEVALDYARSRLREVRAVLAQIDWDDAALRVRRDRDAQRVLLAAVLSWIEGDPARAEALAEPAARLGESGPADPETFAEINQARAADAALLVAVADALAAWTRSHPDDDSARELRARPPSRPRHLRTVLVST